MIRLLFPKKIHLLFGFSTQSKKYILSQFPYPSGELHLGHARVYYIGDTLSRYYKMQNLKVIYPIGFDSFGLPAENAAIVHKKNPKQWTESNIQTMISQLNSLNIDFNWESNLCTHKPEYYKWTQKIFILLFQKGLAYKAESEVNWDPIDKTVLANEQVDSQGRSWRSGAKVQKKMLTQWFLKITKYAQILQNQLKGLDWIQRVKSMQKGWIGYQKGYLLKMEIKNINEQGQKYIQNTKDIQVFVKNIQDLYTKQHLIRYNLKNNKTEGQPEITIGYVQNPFTRKQIEIVLGSEQNVVKESEAQTIVQKVGLNNLKETEVMRIKDWSISRQRFWGTPIPIIYCKNCGTVPVPEQQLPVILPQWKNEGNPLLSQQFRNCKCPKCSRPAVRQTDTMDTFVDSSWYYLRFLDPFNNKKIVDQKLANFWMPVDIYIGGIEHAIMHLLYARFVMRALSDMQVCQIKQPFKELVVQGLVQGKAVRVKETGKYLKPEEIKNYDPKDIQEMYEKMSKSKFNGLNPTTLVDKYGPDALRIALFFAAPPENDLDFNQDLLVSAIRFLRKVEELSKQTIELKQKIVLQNEMKQFSKIYNPCALKIKVILQKLQQSIEKRYMHAYVANVMQFFNEIKSFSKQNESDTKTLTFLFKSMFLPALSIIAPKTVSTLTKNMSQQNIWPHSNYFSNQMPFSMMKGKKLIKTGIVEYKGQTPTEQQIRTQLKLDFTPVIKILKKNVIIIV